MSCRQRCLRFVRNAVTLPSVTVSYRVPMLTIFVQIEMSHVTVIAIVDIAIRTISNKNFKIYSLIYIVTLPSYIYLGIFLMFGRFCYQIGILCLHFILFNLQHKGLSKYL